MGVGGWGEGSQEEIKKVKYFTTVQRKLVPKTQATLQFMTKFLECPFTRKRVLCVAKAKMNK